MKKPLLLVGIAAALLVAGVLLWQRAGRPVVESDAAAIPAPHADSERTAAADESPEEALTATATPAAEPVPAETRSEVEAALLAGRLTDGEGAPLSGASVTWTTLRESFLATWSGWDLQDWDAVERATRGATSSSNGEFEFRAGPPDHDQLDSVVWITLPGRATEMRLLEPGTTPLQLGHIELSPAAAMTVQVVNPFGMPVEGALVEEFYFVPWDWRADDFDPQAARVFKRAWTTGADGTIEVARISDHVLLRASLDEEAAPIWTGAPREHLTLELTGTFQASGRVSYETGMEVPDDMRILCSAEHGGQSRVLTSSEVSGDGSWGPVNLPLGRADGFRFRLEGTLVGIVEEFIPPPPPGEPVVVDFAARPGFQLWALVTGENDEVLFDSTVTMSWERKGVTSTSVRPARDEDGYLSFGDIPPGRVTCVAECKGYATEYFMDVLVPMEPLETLVAKLERAGVVSGRVVSEDQPLEDFEVTWWQPGNEAHAYTKSFSARENGEFELDVVPQGVVSLFACARGLTPSDATTVQVSDEARPEVVLEPLPALRGHGTVIAADSGLPLPSAVLQPFGTSQFAAVAPWGPPHQVQSDGSFDITGFARGQTQVRFSAPGYSHRWVETHAGAGQTVDFGSVALASRQTLSCELIWEGELDATQWELLASGAEPIPLLAFDAEGKLTIEGVSSGVYKVAIYGPERLFLTTTMILEPGGDWLFRAPVGDARTLRVEVVPEPGSPTDTRLTVLARLPGLGERAITQSARTTPGRPVTFGGVLPGPYSIRVQSSDGLTASAEGIVEAGAEETVVQIHLGSRAQLVRLVDGDGAPVPDAWFGIVLPGTPHIGQGGTTNSAGECPVNLAPGDYVAAISHKTLGQRLDVPVKVSGTRNETLDLILDAPFHVELQLLDGALPQAGLQCRLYDLAENNSVPPVNSDEQGRARWNRFADGSYSIRVRHPDYWPTEALVPARIDDNATPIQVRHLGDLEVKVRSATTGLARGLVLDLASEEFGTTVRTWVQEERVTSSSPTLATGSDGMLLLNGLPHGRYMWSARAATGELVTGSVVVSPGGMKRVTVSLP